jgi:hypothetical protein
MADTFTLIAGKPTILKDPEAVLDYTVDFAPWLLPEADTIASATVTGTGVTVDSSAVVGGTAVTMWVSGGTVNTTGNAVVQITTVDGRIDERTVYFKVRNR